MVDSNTFINVFLGLCIFLILIILIVLIFAVVQQSIKMFTNPWFWILILLVIGIYFVLAASFKWWPFQKNQVLTELTV